ERPYRRTSLSASSLARSCSSRVICMPFIYKAYNIVYIDRWGGRKLPPRGWLRTSSLMPDAQTPHSRLREAGPEQRLLHRYEVFRLAAEDLAKRGLAREVAALLRPRRQIVRQLPRRTVRHRNGRTRILARSAIHSGSS